MSEVLIRPADVGLDPETDVQVIVEPFTEDDRPVYGGNNVIVRPKRLRPDENGLISIELEASAGLAPADTPYLVTFKAPGEAELAATILVPEGAGPFEMRDIVSDALDPVSATELGLHRISFGDHTDVQDKAILDAAPIGRVIAKVGPGLWGPVEGATAADVDAALAAANAYTDTRVVKVIIDALGIDAASLQGLTVAQIQNQIVAAITDAAPGTLDTLNELAAALADDPNFATTITNLIAAEEAAREGADADLSARDGTTLGGTTYDGVDVNLDYSTKWGIDGLGDPYYDPDGPAPGEEAVLVVNPDGSLSVVTPGAAITQDWEESPASVRTDLDAHADDDEIHGGGGGASDLPALSDVDDATAPTNGHLLVGDGAKWANRALLEADIPGSITRDAELADALAALVDSSPATLDTLNELAAALGDDPNFATTVMDLLAAKVSVGGAISVRHNPGRYYSGTYVTSRGTAGNLGNGVLWISTAKDFEAETRIVGLALDVTSAATAGGLYRLGIYDEDANGDPGELILDAGTIDATVVAMHEKAVDVLVGPGRVFFAAVPQGAPTNTGTVRAVASSLGDPLLGDDANVSSSNPSRGYTQSGVVGALPDPFAGTPGAGGFSYPLVIFKTGVV